MDDFKRYTKHRLRIRGRIRRKKRALVLIAIQVPFETDDMMSLALRMGYFCILGRLSIEDTSTRLARRDVTGFSPYCINLLRFAREQARPASMGHLEEFGRPKSTWKRRTAGTWGGRLPLLRHRFGRWMLLCSEWFETWV